MVVNMYSYASHHHFTPTLNNVGLWIFIGLRTRKRALHARLGRLSLVYIFTSMSRTASSQIIFNKWARASVYKICVHKMYTRYRGITFDLTPLPRYYCYRYITPQPHCLHGHFWRLSPFPRVIGGIHGNTVVPIPYSRSLIRVMYPIRRNLHSLIASSSFPCWVRFLTFSFVTSSLQNRTKPPVVYVLPQKSYLSPISFAMFMRQRATRQGLGFRIAGLDLYGDDCSRPDSSRIHCLPCPVVS